MSIRFLKGSGGDTSSEARLLRAITSKTPCKIPVLISHDRRGQPFSHSVAASPLASPDGSSTLTRIISYPVTLFGDCYGSHDATISATRDGSLASASIDTTYDLLMHDLPPLSLPSAVLPSPGTSQPWLPASGDALLCVVTSAEPPYAILWASAAWLDLCQFVPAEVLGSDLQCIQGPATSRDLVDELMHHVRARESCNIKGLVNYDKERRPFRHTLQVDYLPQQACGAQAVFRATSTNVTLQTSASHAASERGSEVSDHNSEPQQMWTEELEQYVELMERFGRRVAGMEATGSLAVK